MSRECSGVVHIRRLDAELYPIGHAVLSPMGGYTLAYNLVKNDSYKSGYEIKVGFSRCSPLDSFNRKLGAVIALGRLNQFREQSMVISISLDALIEMGKQPGMNGQPVAEGKLPEIIDRNERLFVNEKQYPFNQLLTACFMHSVAPIFENDPGDPFAIFNKIDVLYTRDGKCAFVKVSPDAEEVVAALAAFRHGGLQALEAAASEESTALVAAASAESEVRNSESN